MQFAITATYSGGPVNGYAHDLTIEDVSNILKSSWATNLSVDETEEGDSEYTYLSEEGEDDDEFWSRCRDVTVSGILDRKDFFQFFDSLCSYAEDCETMGTLGGPANTIGIAPDISIILESQLVIGCIRVTPLADGKCSEKNWNNIRLAFINTFGINGDYWSDFRRS